MSVPAAAATVSVVVVDDTPEIRALLSRGLQRFGPFTVVAEAANGVEGVAEVRRHRPDLVLLDLAMPVMDGLEALPLIREASPGSCVVVLSGFESDRMSRSTLDRGAAAYVEKGTPIAEIARIAGRAVGLEPDAIGPAAQPGRSAARNVDTSAEAAEELARIHAALAVAAHELRGPATVLTALAEVYGADVTRLTVADTRDLLDTIRRQALIVDQLTTDLLVTAQAQRGHVTVNRRVFRVEPVLDGVTRVLLEPASVDVACDPGLTVFADDIRVQQMLGNLLVNAERHGRPPISVSARRVGPEVEFRVTDSGDGVPEAFQSSLFRQFSRPEGQLTSGTGLGLHVVRTLAAAHGGRAWYDPASRGATFCFTLPAESGPRPLT